MKKVNNGKKTHAICLLPVGKYVNIWAIPKYTVKTKTSVAPTQNQVYFCNMILETNVPSFATSFKISFLIGDHCELQSEFFDIVIFCQNRLMFLQGASAFKPLTEGTFYIQNYLYNIFVKNFFIC